MICYIILHYNNTEVTIKCINSLIKIITNKESQIIIVDNGSQNDSYNILQSKFGSLSNLKIIKTKTNLGFARGNNVGYCYAKKIFHPQFIIVCNNDLIFEQHGFEEKLLDIYERYNFDVAGPDIINLDGVHQNPHRTHMLSLKEISKMNRRKFTFLLYLKVKLRFSIFRKINILETIYDRPKRENCSSMLHDESSIVVQGSCIIFSKNYIEQEDTAFCPDTFLYYEEDLLSLRCKKKGYTIKICPEIVVRHLEGKSTCPSGGTEIQKRIFSLSHMLESGRIYKDKLLKMNLF